MLPSVLGLDIPPSNTSLSSNLFREWDPLAARLPSVVDGFRTPSMTAKVKPCEQGWDPLGFLINCVPLQFFCLSYACISSLPACK